MPNHITNQLKVIGSNEQVEKLFNQIRNKKKDTEENKCLIDFNKIIPMPESLNITSGSSVDNAVLVLTDNTEELKKMLDYPWVKDEGITNVSDLKKRLVKNLSPKDLEQGKMALENIEKYGHKDWYSWSIANWGTKWNAYSQFQIEENIISFETAWSTPFPLMEELSRMFPELTIEVTYADEDIGSNCGTYTFANGSLVDEYNPDGWEATRFALKIKGWDSENDITEMVASNLHYLIGRGTELDKNYVQNIVEVISDEEQIDDFLEQVFDECSDDDKENVTKTLKDIALKNECYEFLSKLGKKINE
jgi:hypothetical protein